MANYTYLTLTGLIVPDTETIRDAVADEYKAVFGDDFNTDANTPQGVLITAEALSRAIVVMNNAALANQINPNIAGGVFLDAILALTGLKRAPSLNTTVLCQLTGITGTLIPKGSSARNNISQELFQSVADITLTDGTNEINFVAVNPGAIAASAGSITQIVSAVIGWETINNSADGTLGSLTQSDIQARTLRRNTLAVQGSSLGFAITSAVYATPGVKSLAFRENVTDITQVIDSVTLVPHSIYLNVDGGADLDVAYSILSKKSGGCNYNGNTTVPVYDQYSQQVYNVTFSRPELVPVLAKVYVKQSIAVQNPIDAVKSAVLAYANGQLDGEPGLIVGASVSAFEISGAVNRVIPGLYVYLVETTLASSISYSTNEIPITIAQKATMIDSSIQVIVT